MNETGKLTFRKNMNENEGLRGVFKRILTYFPPEKKLEFGILYL